MDRVSERRRARARAERARKSKQDYKRLMTLRRVGLVSSMALLPLPALVLVAVGFSISEEFDESLF